MIITHMRLRWSTEVMTQRMNYRFWKYDFIPYFCTFPCCIFLWDNRSENGVCIQWQSALKKDPLVWWLRGEVVWMSRGMSFALA